MQNGLANDKTSDREFGNLLNVKDNYPKYVVSLDDFNKGSDIQGIRHMHLSDFLMLDTL